MMQIASMRLWTVACAAALLLGLTGCDSAKEALGMTKQSPDEFSVVTRAPLSIPPDFGLRPPEPGAKRPQEITPRTRAREILLGQPAGPNTQAAANAAVASGKFDKGEAALLRRAGALHTNPNIRNEVNRESAALVAEGHGFMDKLLFWQKPAPPGTIVDAPKEARRLREAAALGNTPDKGTVPVIKRHERALFEGVF